MNRTRTTLLAVAALLPLGMLSACGGGDDATAAGGITLTLAHSYTEDQPQHTCGAEVIKDEVEAADAGMSVEIYPNSQLGGDADRIASVQSGDIDLDLQGASALASVYEPIGVVDAAYAFDSGQQVADFFRGKESEQLKQAFHDASGGVSILGAYSAGAREFTANQPIREPADLDGLRMRFPGSPQFLENAKALGAHATEVAYEELYLALQQGVVDGQENPITNIAALNLPEVQDYLSMTDHQQNSNLVIVGKVWDDLSEQQQQVLQDAVDTAVDKMPGCVADAEDEIISGWKQDGSIKIVDDVDVAAFSEQADAYFRDHLEGKSLEVYEAIKSSAK
ncbi:DctP family TRAP transporter solute-binding subunit [Nocardioides panaciterrulae]|uniref:Tripartite ATP-independent transporter DctP family solute receptor n=1 Tax=Nocardioides panaciterrulae TaxID=661492 RepID=A0A7Y9E3G8_9ACTN|nr:DctP family TRAP transporter solute-binding subunit [Nocardioides panaciterrulae]NYD40317.1 tripartite ATP-independent transporter DctP family solute receptor [Nocardioides panaciterrulae]